MSRPFGDHDGKNSNASSVRVSRFGWPPGNDLIHRLPLASNTTRSPRGDTAGFRIIFASKASGATSTIGRGGAYTVRVSRTRNGIVSTLPSATAILRILPPAQMTMCRESGIQSKLG